MSEQLEQAPPSDGSAEAAPPDARRVAIVVSKTLSPGAAANVSALLMGQLVVDDTSLYGTEAVRGADGMRHAAIRFSTIVLRGRPGQLRSLAEELDAAGISSCVFSSLGQTLNNEFDEYRRRLAGEASDLVGVAMSADDATVRALTRKFSLLV